MVIYGFLIQRAKVGSEKEEIIPFPNEVEEDGAKILSPWQREWRGEIGTIIRSPNSFQKPK